MRKFFWDKSFDPLDIIMTKPTMMKYAIKFDDIDISFDNFTENAPKYHCSDFISGEMDLRNSMVSFFCSYKYKYGRKTTINTFIRNNFSRFKFKTEHSAQSSIARYKRIILNGNQYLSDTFSDIFQGMETHRSKTLPEIGANILAYSICRYYNNPTDLSKTYDIKNLNDFLQGTNFTNVEEYIFERIYHIKLICEIINFYYEFKSFIDELSFDILMGKDKIDPYKYKYFSVNMALSAFREYWLKNALDLETLQERGSAKLDVLVLNLCRFSLLDDVYTRTDVMKSLIREMIADIMKEEVCLDKIKQCVSFALRSSVITDDVLYYSAINYSMSEYIRRELPEYTLQNELEIIRKLISCEDSIFESNEYYLNETIDGLENCIKSIPFDLNLKEVVSHTTDKNSILHKLLKEIYYSNQIKQRNEDFYKWNFFDDEFYKEYRNLFDNQMKRVIESNKLNSLF